MHDRRRPRARQVLRQPGADALHGGYLAGLVQLPQAEEPPHLAFEIAGRLAEVLEARRPPVHGVDLHERVDQLLADPAALRRRVQRGGDARDDHLALDALHHVERRADHRGVLAHREHLAARARGCP